MFGQHVCLSLLMVALLQCGQLYYYYFYFEKGIQSSQKINKQSIHIVPPFTVNIYRNGNKRRGTTSTKQFYEGFCAHNGHVLLIQIAHDATATSVLAIIAV